MEQDIDELMTTGVQRLRKIIATNDLPEIVAGLKPTMDALMQCIYDLLNPNTPKPKHDCESDEEFLCFVTAIMFLINCNSEKHTITGIDELRL